MAALRDCIVFSENFATHLVRLRQDLERLRKAGFKVAFLGYIVTPSGILPNPEKVKALMNVERSHDIHTSRAFLGLSSYF
ncbi:Retrovirus Polyprotein [Phytophthora megakarya]|uniref:Retrovirus Polyprotein n=1 Tax=Phytophthora megakarya TaxID=4795 RepID=A0A225W2G4_9STRA|nr:Retrovirus Polyprotein [Phytophthora megakarya]